MSTLIMKIRLNDLRNSKNKTIKSKNRRDETFIRIYEIPCDL